MARTERTERTERAPRAPRSPRSALLIDGDLPGLIALAAAAEAQVAASDEPAPEVALLADARVLGPAAGVCVRQQADRLGLASVPQEPIRITPDESGHMTTDAAILHRAAAAAVRMGCHRLVWAATAITATEGAAGHRAQPDEDLDRIAAAVDRALLIGRLVSIDAAALGQRDLKIEVPYIDLSAAQIADLALDLDAPIEACWWATEHATADPARAEQHARFWTDQLESFGWSTDQAESHASRQAQLRAEELA